MGLIGQLFGPAVSRVADGVAGSVGQYMPQDPTSERPMMGVFDPNNLAAREALVAQQMAQIQVAKQTFGVGVAGGLLGFLKDKAFLIGMGLGAGIGVYATWKFMKKNG